MYKVIILDLDGTLVKTSIDWNSIRVKIGKLLGLSEHAQLRPIATAVLTQYRNSEKFPKVMKLIEDEELRSIEGAEYPKELPELLREVKRCGYKLALVTLRSRRTAKPLLIKLSILDVFDVVMTRDEAHDRSSQLVKIVEYFEVGREDVLFIGDWTGDEEAGRATGIRTVIVKGPEEVVVLLSNLLRSAEEVSNS